MSFKIIVGFDNYEVKDGKNIYSDICINIDDFYFPSDDWDDFTTVILSWWEREIISLIDNKIKFAELLFMEGSYKMWIHKKQDTLKIDFISDRHSDNKIVYSCDVSIRDFILEVIKCYNQIINSNLLSKNYLDVFKNSSETLANYL